MCQKTSFQNVKEKHFFEQHGQKVKIKISKCRQVAYGTFLIILHIFIAVFYINSSLAAGNMMTEDSSKKIPPNPDNLGTINISETDIISSQIQNQITISRPIFTEETFNEGHPENAASHSSRISKLRGCCRRKLSDLSCRGLGLSVIKLFPIIGWLREYNFRKDIFGDVTSGLTTTVMRIPQGTVIYTTECDKCGLRVFL